MAGKLYVARESFVVGTEDGGSIQVRAGIDRVREGHWLLVGREDMFELAPVDYEVEDATAEPGVKRGERSSEAEPEEPVKRGPGRPRKQR